mgnify:CR=1 FL=1
MTWHPLTETGGANAGLPALLGRFPGSALAVTAVTGDFDDDALTTLRDTYLVSA